MRRSLCWLDQGIFGPYHSKATLCDVACHIRSSPLQPVVWCWMDEQKFRVVSWDVIFLPFTRWWRHHMNLPDRFGRIQQGLINKQGTLGRGRPLEMSRSLCCDSLTSSKGTWRDYAMCFINPWKCLKPSATVSGVGITTSAGKDEEIFVWRVASLSALASCSPKDFAAWGNGGGTVGVEEHLSLNSPWERA